jgi:hypothetical protein
MAEVDACIHEGFDEFCLIGCHDLSANSNASNRASPAHADATAKSPSAAIGL